MEDTLNAFSGRRAAILSGLDYRYVKRLCDDRILEPIRVEHQMFLLSLDEIYVLKILAGLRKCAGFKTRGEHVRSQFFTETAVTLLGQKHLLESRYLIIQDSKNLYPVTEDELRYLGSRSQGFLVNVNCLRGQVDSKIASMVS